jgi:hypothetical protein
MHEQVRSCVNFRQWAVVKGEQAEDLYERNAEVCYKQQVSNRLRKKTSKCNIILHSNAKPENAVMRQ